LPEHTAPRSLHDALPICGGGPHRSRTLPGGSEPDAPLQTVYNPLIPASLAAVRLALEISVLRARHDAEVSPLLYPYPRPVTGSVDRKSTRLNSSHQIISY